MIPGLNDSALRRAITFNLGVRKEPPHEGRFTFTEKVEYWALIWGTVIMAVTGLMMWNPIATTNLLPGQFIPAAKAAPRGGGGSCRARSSHLARLLRAHQALQSIDVRRLPRRTGDG